MRKKGSEKQSPAPGGRVTPADVQQIEFRLAFRGYNERDVDAFLDRVTEDLAWYGEEVERLRSAPVAAVAGAPTGDVAAAEAEAAAILDRARREADEIVRAAQRKAAASVTAAGAAPGDARAAVAPFLNTEREFLQSLGALVQGHAEEVKQMVLALRARAEALPEAPRIVEADGGDGTADGAPPDSRPVPSDAASAKEIRERLGEPESEPRPDERAQPERVIDLATEPAYSSEGAPAGEGRERSLRELFWGDD